MASFLSALNTRDDGYGGSRENRVRLPLEVIAAVRARVGRRGVVGCRFLGDDVIEGGNRVDDAAWFGVELARAGLDFLSLSKGGKFEDAKQPKVGEAAYPVHRPERLRVHADYISDARGPFGRNVAARRATIRAAVRAAGFDDADRRRRRHLRASSRPRPILARGEADIVASARQIARRSRLVPRRCALGRGAEIRRCEFTNYCEALDQQHKQVTCKLWDRDALDEPDVTLDPTGRRRLTAPKWSNH